MVYGNEAINTISLNWMYRMARLNLLTISDAAIQANLKRRTKDPKRAGLPIPVNDLWVAALIE